MGKLNWNVPEPKNDPYCKDVFVVIDDFCSKTEIDLVPVGFDDFFTVLLEILIGGVTGLRRMVSNMDLGFLWVNWIGNARKTCPLGTCFLIDA